MSTLERIAYFQGIRDETPNQELARDLAVREDRAGIQEIANALWHEKASVRSDCIKVLYEIGYLKPELIADDVDLFLRLLSDRQNRMVWGAMIALSTIASQRAEAIFAQIDAVIQAIDKGTVITVVSGVKVLGQVAAREAYREHIFPVLLEMLRTCIPRDVPTHAESILPAVKAANRAEFVAILELRQPELSKAQMTRLHKVIRQLPVD